MNRRAPTKAFSVRQPWAWAIVHGGKRIENRRSSSPWRKAIGQSLWIHASGSMTPGEYSEALGFMRESGLTIRVPRMTELELGGIVGRAKLVAVMSVESARYHLRRDGCDAELRWATGPFCLILREVEPVEFVRCRGALGLFRPEVAA